MSAVIGSASVGFKRGVVRAITTGQSIESDSQLTGVEDTKVAPAAPWHDPSQTLDWIKDRALWLYGLAGTVISMGLGAVEGNTGPLLMNDSAVSFGLLVIVLLLILLLIRRRRAHRYLSSDSEGTRISSAGRRSVFQDSVPGDSQSSQPVVPTVVEDSIGAGFVTELETQRGVAVTSDEVDPLTEAEIYIAYGRSSQAEKILRDAISRFPEMTSRARSRWRSISNVKRLRLKTGTSIVLRLMNLRSIA